MKAFLKRLKSKTYWLGIATMVLGGLEAAQATGSMPDMFNGTTRAVATVLISILIFILREITTKPIIEK